MRLLLLVALTLFWGCEKEEEKRVDKKVEIQEKKPLHVEIQEIEKELEKIDSVPYLEEYIENVINHGSDGKLGFASGAMDAGFAQESDAKDIARFVVTLSGKKSSDDKKAKEASMFFTSNCGGCHGNDGKGLNGAFPNLTLKSLKGIELKKEMLLLKLDRLKKEEKK